MGAYRSTPIMDKEQEEGENDWLKYASTSMQGWRVSQEDAHNAIIDFAGNSALFAVYDGHGGSEVAAYAAENLPAILQQNENFKKGDIEKALTECFIDFDKTLLTEDVAAILQSLKESAEGKPKNRPKESEDDEGELWEEAAALSKEAEVSVDKIVKEYMKMNKRLHDHFGIVYEKESAEPSVERIVKRRRVIEVTEEGDAPAEANGKDVKDENGTAKKNGVVSKSDTEEPKSEDAPSDDTNAQFSDTDEATEDTEKLTLKTTVEVTTKKPLSNGDNTSEIESKDNGDGENANGAKASDEDETTAEGPSTVNESDAAEDDSEDEDEDYDEEEEEEGSEESSASEDDVDLDALGGGNTPGVDSGTTACVALLFQDRVIVANVGDSRAILCRNGRAIDLSVDHKPEDAPEKERVEAAGGHVSEDGRVNGGLNLSRALGDHCYKTNDELPPEKQLISPLPDIRKEEITKDDTFLVIACDGIWNSLNSQEVVDFINARREKSLKEISAELCNHCCAPDTSGDGTGCDNMTIIIVDLKKRVSSA